MKKAASLILSLLLAGTTVPVNAGRPLNQTGRELIQKSYLELLELDDIPKLAPDEVQSIEDQYKKEREVEDSRLRKAEDEIKKDLKAARKRLEGLNKKSSRDNPEAARQRTEIHCEVQRLESELTKTRTQREKSLPVLYQNKFAKLELIQKWPAIRARIARPA